MAPARKSPQLEAEIRDATALVWTHNDPGPSDMVLLLYSIEEGQFVRFCQIKRKSKPVLRLGAWFKIVYQNYVKCQSRISVHTATQIAPIIETRIMGGGVQFCVDASCTSANLYFDEFRYHCRFGDFTLCAEQGGGPAILQVWCHLRSTAWAQDPVFDEVRPNLVANSPTMISDRRRKGPKTDSSFTKCQEIASPPEEEVDLMDINGECSPDLIQLETPTEEAAKNARMPPVQSAQSNKPIYPDDYELGAHSPALSEQAMSWKGLNFDEDEAAEEGSCTPQWEEEEGEGTEDDYEKKAEEEEGEGTEDDYEKEEEWKWNSDESVVEEEELTTNASMGGEQFDNEEYEAITTARPSPTFDTPSHSRNWHWTPHKWEPIQMDLSERNRAFDWLNYCIGVIVDQIRQPSTGKLVCYKVAPFCTGEPKICELFLESDTTLQLGAWVQFHRKNLFQREIDPKTFKCHEPMFQTIPCFGEVIIECEIVIPKPKGGVITTKWYQWQNEVEMRICQTKTRFIHRVFDELKLITAQHLGRTLWASLEYRRKPNWGGMKGYWRIVHIRPSSYGKQIG